MNQCNRKCLYTICATLLAFTLTACNQGTPNINQAFIDANNNAYTNEATTTPTSPITEDIQPTMPSVPEETEPIKKPDGFTWNDWGDTSTPTNPSTPDTEENNNPTEPTQPSKPTGVNISQSLKEALSFLGKTTKNGSNLTAYSPTKNNDGGISIVHVKSTSSSATQTDYVFYESQSDYDNAKSMYPHKTYNDQLRLITISTSETFPITNPETFSYVMFSGYRLWR